MIKQKIKIPLYFGDLILIKDKSWDSINKKYGYNLSNQFAAVAFARYTKTGKSKYYIAFVNKVDNATIAHEIVHVVNQIFIDRLMKVDPENDEPQAYLTGWMFKQVEKFLKKK